MAIHEKLPALMEPYEKLARVANNASELARAAGTRTSGTIYIPNGDGTGTLIGELAGFDETGKPNGIQQFVYDTEPPSTPTNVKFFTGDGAIHAFWGGTLKDGIPADFAYVEFRIEDGNAIGRISKAGSCTYKSTVGESFNLFAVAVDMQGNVSDQTETFTLKVSDNAEELEEAIESLKLEVGTLEARVVDAETLIAKKADIEQLEADEARIKTIEANYITAEQVEADYVKTETLEADYLSADEIAAKYVDADTVKATYATIEELKATDAKIDDLEAGTITADNLDAKVAEIAFADIDTASMQKLSSEFVTTETLQANYANIDFANISDAAVENLYSKSGVIKDLIVQNGQIVSGELNAVTINGDQINANTLKADRLLLQGEDGLYYALNTNGVDITGEQTNTNSLDGKVILAKSIVADQISVSDLVAFGATIAGINLEEGRLYSRAKSEVDATTEGFYMDEDGQFSLGGNDDYIRYIRQEDGTYKLDISSSSLNITVADGTSKSILQHTADGFIFDMSSITNAISANQSAIESSIGENGSVTSAIETLNQKTGWIRFGLTDLNNQYGLILGSEEEEEEGKITLQLVNNQLAFVQDGVRVAYITESLFHIRSGVLTEELHLGEATAISGSWIWRKRPSEHLGLRYTKASNLYLPVGTNILSAIDETSFVLQAVCRISGDTITTTLGTRFDSTDYKYIYPIGEYKIEYVVCLYSIGIEEDFVIKFDANAGVNRVNYQPSSGDISDVNNYIFADTETIELKYSDFAKNSELENPLFSSSFLYENNMFISKARYNATIVNTTEWTNLADIREFLTCFNVDTVEYSQSDNAQLVIDCILLPTSVNLVS